MFHPFLLVTQESTKTISQFLDPTVIAALIAAIVAFASVLLNFRSLRLQRLESERQEIYKKLNSFYGPMRLNLNTSNELYKLFRKSICSRLENPNNFRTLPYILRGSNQFNKSEEELFNQIIRVGRKMESIINQNAGLIDDGNLHKEMVELKTHIIIIRSAFERKFNSGEEIIQLLQNHTFPKKIAGNVDLVFEELKNRLDELNQRKYYKKLQVEKTEDTNNSPFQESHDEHRPEDSPCRQNNEE